MNHDHDGPRSGLDPVTRRRFLAWMGTSAAAIAVADGVPVQAQNAGDPRSISRLSKPRTMYFGLNDYLEGRRSDLPRLIRFELSVLGERHPLEVIPGGRAGDRIVAKNSMARRADRGLLTHHVPGVRPYAALPVAMPLFGYDELGNELILGYPIAVPDSGVRAAAQMARRVRDIGDVFAGHPELRRLGIDEPPRNLAEVGDWNDLYETTAQIAQSLVFKHPTVMNFDSDSAAITQNLLADSAEVNDLADQVKALIATFGMYGQAEPMTDGTETQLAVPNDPTGTVLATTFSPFIEPTTITYDDVQYPVTEQDIAPFVASFNNAVLTVSNQVQADVQLEGDDGGSWVETPGVAPTTTPVGDSLESTVDYAIDGGWHSLTKASIGDITTGSGGVTVPITVDNWNLKIFGAYAQFIDADGDVIDGGGPKISKQDLTQLIGVAGGARQFMGIPYTDSAAGLSVTIPPDAVTTRILLCSLGWGNRWKNFYPDNYDSKAYPGPCTEWVIFTALMTIGVPVIMLVLDAAAAKNVFQTASTTAEDYGQQIANSAGEDGEMEQILQQEMTQVLSNFPNSGLIGVFKKMLIGSVLTSDVVQTAGSHGSIMAVLKAAGLMFLQAFTAPTVKGVMTVMLEDQSADVAAEAIPIVGEAFAAVAVATDVATLAQGITEFLTEDWVLERTLQATYTASVSVGWDKDKDSSFPAAARRWVLTPHLSKNRTLGAVEDPNFQSDGRWDPAKGDLKISVPGVLVGGRIQYTISFLDENGNQVGTGTSGWLDNSDPSDLPSPQFDITELAVPITPESTFDREWTTEWDDTTSPAAYIQNSSLAVPGTLGDQVCQSLTDICAPGSITVGTVTGRMGYVWEAQNGWWVRQLSTSSNPGEYVETAAAPYTQRPLLVYDVLNDQPVDGDNFLLDPVQPGNSPNSTKYFVRQMNLTAAGFGINENETLGVFTDVIDAVALHPAGLLVAVTNKNGKLHVLHLPDTPGDASDESTYPTAAMYAGTGNPTGTRPGLTEQPIDLAIAINGTILVLEAGANRIQAFDLRGNPVPYFPERNNDPNSQYYLQLDSTKTLLGIDVDGTGAIYVHNYTGTGTEESEYGVDVYKPDGTFVFRGSGINAGTLSVDYWRNIYSQNYVPVQNKSDGTPHAIPQGVGEPSISTWIPDTPSG